jgi:hypothetical protein
LLARPPRANLTNQILATREATGPIASNNSALTIIKTPQKPLEKIKKTNKKRKTI